MFGIQLRIATVLIYATSGDISLQCNQRKGRHVSVVICGQIITITAVFFDTCTHCVTKAGHTSCSLPLCNGQV